MKNTYFTVGPTHLYKTVASHIKTALENDIPSISHRSKQYEQIHETAVTHVRKLLRIPPSHQIFFVGSSLESMERIIQNCVEKYSFHFINGEFSKKFFSMAKDLGKSPQSAEYAPGQGYDLTGYKLPKKTELICITQNETSTGAMIPTSDIYALRKQYPEMLLALDVVSSIPYVNLHYKQTDLAFFSSQKGFGLPAGLGVLVVSPKALEKAEYMKKKGISIGSYHSFVSMNEKAVHNQTPETPNVLDIYLLGKVAGDFLSTGIETIRTQTEKRATLYYDFFDNHKTYIPFVKESRFRSQTTIVIDLKGETKKVQEMLKKQHCVVSSGYGPFKAEHMRIANFPSHSLAATKTFIKALS